MWQVFTRILPAGLLAKLDQAWALIEYPVVAIGEHLNVDPRHTAGGGLLQCQRGLTVTPWLLVG